MTTQIVTLRDSFMTGVTQGFNSLIGFIPALLGAAIVLVVGWLIAKLVARLVEGGLHAVKFERAVSRGGIHTYLAQIRSDLTVSHVLAVLAQWFVFLVFVQASANVLQMPQVTAIINSILLFIPNLLVAMVIMVIGVMFAQFFGSLVQASVSRLGITRANVFSTIARYAIVGFAVIAALNQIGVATVLINTLFIGLVASVSLAIGLSFGLGGQGVASDITRRWYSYGKPGVEKQGQAPIETKRAS